MTMFLKNAPYVAIPTILYIVAAFTMYTYDYYIFNDYTMTIGQSGLSHS